MRILLLGASGLLGRYVTLLGGHEWITVSRTPGNAAFSVDASDAAALEKLVAAKKPDAVINCVKNSFSSDMAETRREETWRSNVVVADNIAKLQKRFGYPIVHISSDWVYEGREGEVYTEETIPYPQNFYSYSKAVAEERIAAQSDDFLILRPTGLFGLDSRGGNFFMRARDALGSGKEFGAAIDQFSQPIYAGELARIIGEALGKKARGIYNATGKDYCSRYELALMFCDAFGWDKALVRKTSGAGRAMRVPNFLKVDITKLERGIAKVRPLREQVAALKGESG
ncbi:MAG TPA: sugar nucleotide-binding protein [Candidatus Bilamarchaeum sp.]|nr:sugar nucleotide-binding protein [Candidatus Bilamarchaeum sp.]